MTTFHMSDMRKHTETALADRRGGQEVCLYWHHAKHDTAWCNKEDIRGEAKRFFHLRKKGLITMREDNNGSLELEGKTFHYFVVQHADEECDTIDPFAMANGLMVSGYVYFFTRKENRDALYKYIMGVK